MLDDDQTNPAQADEAPAKPVVKKTTRKAPAKRAAKKAVSTAPAETTPAKTTSAESPAAAETPAADAPAKPAVKKTTRKAAAKRPAKKAAATPEAEPATEPVAAAEPVEAAESPAPAKKATARKAAAKRTTKKAAAAPAVDETTPAEAPAEAPAEQTGEQAVDATGAAVLFQVPDKAAKAPAKKATRKKSAAKPAKAVEAEATADEADDAQGARAADTEPADTEPATTDPAAAETDGAESSTDGEAAEGAEGEGGATRRRRRRGGRRRRKSGDAATGEDASEESADDAESDEAGDAGDAAGDESGEGGESSSRRRRRRRRAGEDGGSSDDSPNTVTRVRKPRSAEDQITSVSGSTRLEAKKQRRREGREAGRRRAPIVSEAEFLARREAVERVMVIRQRKDLTQIAVLEDKVLVEHYVARESQTSLIGNIYLGRVQNVLPSMEAAFVDIGKGRNAVLYAGEVNWSALGHKEGQPRKIESVLSSGQAVLVQVTKDPVGHKGARLTSQISLAGRFLVYVPDGTTSGISRKLPDTERNRLKRLLKEIVPDTAGVIVRTAAEGASEEELTRDVERLKARWEDVEKKAANKGNHTQLLYGEPDLTLKVVRDLFTEDFTKLVIEGDDAWSTVHDYVEHVAPDLLDRVEKFEAGAQEKDVFAVHRIEEQIHKGLDRKVWLPSGGSLIIDRTEAMTVVDVNTGKFTGSGGNLEETVTKNNLEAAEEIVRQLRLRDIGGIIVVDFIDMVLESNRDLVLRRLVECLGRDRTRHQVAEVTSLGLVQMTRKRIGTGLLEAFSENCEHCHGRGVVIKDAPVEPSKAEDEGRRGGRRRGRGKGSSDADAQTTPAPSAAPSPKDVAAMARHDKATEDKAADDTAAEDKAAEETAADDKAQEKPEDKAPQQSEERAEPKTERAEPKAESTPESATPKGDGDVSGDASGDVPPAAATQPAPEQVEPAKPAVVTRTRRRAASRPAGPPAELAAESPSDSADSAPADTAAGDDGAAPDASAIEHVPIKRKGTRKR